MKKHIVIRAIRAIRGISQKELATKTGLDPSYISLIESGAREPSKSNMLKLLDALDLSLIFTYALGCEKETADYIDYYNVGRELHKIIHQDQNK